MNSHRIAVDPQRGRKVFTLQTLPVCRQELDELEAGQESIKSRVAKCRGFAQRAK